MLFVVFVDGTCDSSKEVISSIPVKSEHVSNFVKFRKRPSHAKTDSVVDGIEEKERLCLNIEDFYVMWPTPNCNLSMTLVGCHYCANVIM